MSSTFAATPAETARRFGTRSRWHLIFLAALGTMACSSEGTPPTPFASRADHSPLDHELVFSEEFEDQTLDRGKWCTRHIFGAGPRPQVEDAVCQAHGKGTLDFFNDEKQRYRDFNTRGQPLHVVSQGKLKILATPTGETAEGPYDSAMIRSKFEFKPAPGESYYVTARLRMPNVKGSWPAFWMIGGMDQKGDLGWPPEITIVDAALNVKDDKHNMLGQGSVVKGAQARDAKRDITYAREGYSRLGMLEVDRTLREVWVETAVLWDTQRVCFYLDGEPTVCENYAWVNNDGNPANAAHLIVNLAVGGNWAGRHGIDEAGFPTQLEVDHVRVYRRAAQ